MIWSNANVIDTVRVDANRIMPLGNVPRPLVQSGIPLFGSMRYSLLYRLSWLLATNAANCL